MLPIEKKWSVDSVFDPALGANRYFADGNWWTGLKLEYATGTLEGRWAGFQTQDCYSYNPV
ncbi:MAG TPA: hypothetical protein VF791_02220 [Pyrinomonadaceae bacterium]